MQLRVKHEQLVRAPLEVVWAASVDLMRQPEWQPKVRSVDVLTPGPVAPGTRYKLHARAGGQRVPIDVEVIEMAPMRMITYRMDYSTQKFTTLDRTELADVDNGVMVIMSSWFLNIGAVRLGISKTFRFMEQRQLHSMATRFAALVERG